MATSSQFKIKQYEGFGGKFVDSDYLAAAFDTSKPHMFENLFTKIYAAMNMFGNKPLLSMISKNKLMIDDEIYRWPLQGSEEKSLRSVEVVETSTAPGINGTSFKIKLDEDWVSAPEVLMGEDNDYAIRIVNGPIPDGTGFIYECILEEDNPVRYFPVELLAVGKEFCKAWTSVQSEMNDEFGGQYYASSYLLESQVGFFGQEFTITDKALRQEGRIGIPLIDGKGNKVERFLPMAEMKMFDTFEMSKEIQLTYGKRSTKQGKNGYWRKTGPGLREQLKDGNVEYYSGDLTEARLRDFLLDIFFARNDRSNRKVRVMTGTMGSMMFHRLLANAASGFLTTDSHFIKSAGTGVTSNDLQFGAQFTRYVGPEGIEVEVYYNPQYDNFQYCKKADPIETNRPVDSWRMTFLDFAAPSSTSFGSNINYLEVKDSYNHGYITGTVGPNGPIQGGATSRLVGAYQRWVQGSAGVQIVDVSRTGELIREIED